MILLTQFPKKPSALQVTTIINNGYFETPLGSVKILDHYHNFLFFINTTKLENNYNNLIINSIALHQRSLSDKLTHKIFLQLETNLHKIKQLLDKLDYHRVKRGLVNALGKAVKFLTGNLDDDDLKIINENLEVLHKNQNSEIDKINKLTSFANHLSMRYSEDAKLLNANILSTQKILQNLTNTADFRILLQNEVYQSEILLNTLSMIERTISLSLHEIPNLELIRVNELLEISKHLRKIYDTQQLLQFDDVHLFKILESTKLFIIGSDQAITFLFKVPILKPFVANYSQIYPIPNRQDVVIIPPKKYLIKIDDKEYWTNEECQTIDPLKVCLLQPIQTNCSLNSLKSCSTAKIDNEYKITYVLKNRQLLVLFKSTEEIIEDCHGTLSRKEVQGTKLLTSKCRIIIGSSTYDYTVPVFEIPIQNVSEVSFNYHRAVDLQLRHLEIPDDLLQEAEELNQPLYLQPLTQIAHLSTTIGIILCVCVFVFIILRYRRRIREILCKPRQIVYLKKTEDPHQMESLNEDVQS